MVFFNVSALSLCISIFLYPWFVCILYGRPKLLCMPGCVRKQLSWNPASKLQWRWWASTIHKCSPPRSLFDYVRESTSPRGQLAHFLRFPNKVFLLERLERLDSCTTPYIRQRRLWSHRPITCVSGISLGCYLGCLPIMALNSLHQPRAQMKTTQKRIPRSQH